jgi:hypothetical protein
LALLDQQMATFADNPRALGLDVDIHGMPPFF